MVQANLQLGSFDIECDFPIVIFNQRPQPLVSRQCEFVFAFFDHRDRDLFLNPRIVGEKFLQAIPNFERFFSPLGSLVYTTELPKDLQHVRPTRLALDRTFECSDSFLWLADQQQALSHIVTGQRVFGPKLFRLHQRVDGFCVFATMRFEHPQQHPRRSVFRIFFSAIPQAFQELVQRPELNVMPVDTLQRRASTRAFFQDRKESVSDLDTFRFFVRKFILRRTFDCGVTFTGSGTLRRYATGNHASENRQCYRCN